MHDVVPLCADDLVSEGEDEDDLSVHYNHPSVHAKYPLVHDVVPSCANEFRPKVSMVFPYFVEGVHFYNSYASKVGFDTCNIIVRKSRDGTIIWKYVTCSKEGYKFSKGQPVCTVGVEECGSYPNVREQGLSIVWVVWLGWCLGLLGPVITLSIIYLGAQSRDVFEFRDEIFKGE